MECLAEMKNHRPNILFELIITNQCNKRCPYCDLNFDSIYQTQQQLELFSDFLSHNQGQAENILVNFF